MGCGCGSNFSGKSNFVKKEKPCTCGRNPGGSCQCNNTNRTPDSRWQRPQGLGANWNSSSSLMGGNVSQAISAPLSATGNNIKRKLNDNRKKFSSFMGKVKPKRKQHNFVDIKKHNISPEHYFEYNKRPFETLRRTTDSFKNYNDLAAMNYEL